MEECWRDDLEPISKRRLAVLDPLEVVTGLKLRSYGPTLDFDLFFLVFTHVFTYTRSHTRHMKHKEIVDYEKEEKIEKITDLPEQTPDASCARTLSTQA